MTMKGTWETTSGGGGGGSGKALLALVGIVVAVAVLGPVVRAAMSLIHTVLIVGAAVLAAAAVAAIVAVVIRLHRQAVIPARSKAVITAEVVPGDVRPQRAIPAGTDRVAIGAPVRPQVHNHIHVHLSGDPVADAEAVRALREGNG
jgi:hypothetical protein